MSEKEVKDCPKCGGKMEKGARITSASRGWIPHAVTLAKEGDFYGDKILPFYCEKCGFIELYREIPRREKKQEEKKDSL